MGGQVGGERKNSLYCGVDGTVMSIDIMKDVVEIGDDIPRILSEKRKSSTKMLTEKQKGELM